MNTVWLLVVCISIVFAAINGRIDGFTKAMFEAGKAAVEVCLYLVAIVSLWLGLTKILEDSRLDLQTVKFLPTGNLVSVQKYTRRAPVHNFHHPQSAGQSFRPG